MANDPTYYWSASSRRFRTASGQFVARTTVREALDATLDSASLEARSHAEALANGSINLSTFIINLKTLTKSSIVACGTVAAGGKANLTPAILGQLGGMVKAQYAYLDILRHEIDNGLKLDGAFLARVAMYPLAGTAAYEAILRTGDIAAGWTQERRLLHSNESCRSCLEYASRGWQEAGTLPLPGRECQCLTNCRCSLERRRPGKAAMSRVTTADSEEAGNLLDSWNRFLAMFGKGGSKVKSVAKSATKSTNTSASIPATKSATKSPKHSTDSSSHKLSGGAWRTVNGSPVYIKGGKIVAGNAKIVEAAGKAGGHSDSHSPASLSSTPKVAGRSHTIDSYAAHHGIDKGAAKAHLDKLTASGHAASHSGDHHFVAHHAERPVGSKVGVGSKTGTGGNEKKSSTGVADRVAKTAKVESGHRTDAARNHLASAKSGQHDVATSHKHIDRAARSATKGELFEAAKTAGHNVEGIRTKKDLVGYLKAHAENRIESGRAKSTTSAHPEPTPTSKSSSPSPPQSSPPSSSSAQSRPSASDRQILSTIHKAVRNPSLISGGKGHASPELVAIHKLRDHVEATYGKVDAERFNRIMMKQWNDSPRKGHELLSVSDNRLMDKHQLDRSIPGMNETIAYAVRKDRDVKTDRRRAKIN